MKQARAAQRGRLGEESGEGDPCAEPGSCPDLPDEELPSCSELGTCNQLDLLIVVDNSRFMVEEQRNVAANFTGIVETLRAMWDADGVPEVYELHIMVMTTDVGHPLCGEDSPAGYAPAMGAPQTEACVDRLDAFVSPDQSHDLRGACTDVCPESVLPSAPFIATSREGVGGHDRIEKDETRSKGAPQPEFGVPPTGGRGDSRGGTDVAMDSAHGPR